MASNEYGRIDDTESLASGTLLPEPKHQKTTITGVPSPARHHDQSSHLPGKAPVAKLSSKSSSLTPSEPAVQMCRLTAKRSPWLGSRGSGHGTIGHYNPTLPAQTENSMSEYQSLRHKALAHKSQDPEKGLLEGTARQSSRCTIPPSKIEYTYSDVSDEDSNAEEHAIWILIYLLLFSPFLSLLFSLYALLITTTILLLFPLCIWYQSHTALPTQFHRFLSPPVSFQLDLIYSSLDDSGTTTASSSCMLILVNLFGPAYAAGIAVAAGVAAVFWCFAAILGDPGGKDGKDVGRAAVLGVRGWWEAWLGRGVR